jgi:hypothetical protein
MNPIGNYVEQLAERFGAGWNRFWFTPADPRGVCTLRLLTGLLAVWYLLSFSADLVTWFGPDGILPVETVAQMTREPDGSWNARLSYLYYAVTPGQLRGVHVAGLAVLTAFTAGIATRISSILALIVVLSYVHRAPVITGPFEPILALLLFYLCFAPCGQTLSIDSWLRRTGRWPAKSRAGTPPDLASPSVSARVCLRLIQVHVAGIYAISGLTKLGGSDTWWMGQAMWWLIARSESRMVDVTWLATHPYLVNAWTQGVVILEIAFAVLIWNRWARPLLLVASTLHWILIGLVTGLVSFAAAMLVANVAFLDWSARSEQSGGR